MATLLAYKNSTISYSRYGSGDALLICLHGFGEAASSFAFLEKSLGERFTIIALNMPFHGETIWNEGLTFTVTDLFEIIKSLPLAGKPELTVNMHLLGYSMGGRLALAFFQDYPHCVKSIALVAPDGLHKNRWYWFATQTALGNRAFKFTMHYPQWFLGMVKLLGKIGLLNKSVAKFVSYYLGDETIRMALYKRWTTMRTFRPSLTLIKNLAFEKQVPIKILFGAFDRIILYQRGEKFQQGHEDLIKVFVIKAGHQLMQEKYVADIIELLNP
ncbi:MAG: alpha/beta hydrolase [Chitinophagaceae bacterium]